VSDAQARHASTDAGPAPDDAATGSPVPQAPQPPVSAGSAKPPKPLKRPPAGDAARQSAKQVTAQVVDVVEAVENPVQPAAQNPVPDESLPPALIELAQAHGVATEFWDWQGRHGVVPRSTILAVLAALDVDASSDAAISRSLTEVRERPWRAAVPDVTVVRQGSAGRVLVHVENGAEIEVWVELEDGGGQVRLVPDENTVDPRVIDGRLIGETSFGLPADLPLGWHQVNARFPGGEESRPLVVAPARLELPPALADKRAWGFMTQLYSVRSQFSWGLGDLADLAELASWSARDHGADFVLVNPLHANEPTSPMEASPYLPTTRRFVHPLYLRIEDIREVAYMPSTDRALIEWQAEAMRGMNIDPVELDRDTVWDAKRAALETVFAQPRSRARQASFEAYCDREGEGLLDFASWCALSERYGLPMTSWPAHALDARSRAVSQIREELADRVQFYMWLQWCLDEQLATAHRLALEAGMSIGVVHDLAVGVHPDGADVWSLADVLAGDVTVGAPPDAFNQQGQDWSQPPWRPDRLAQQGYAPYRDMVRTVLRHAGGLRVDHIVGLFRLWWIPRAAGATAGTYVRYDHEALIGILALEAHRAGAFVVGEDLGTVEPWARDYLRERGVLGTSILWFERDEEGQPLKPQAWRELCLATVTTHDLPPTAGYLAGEHIELRDRLGLLTRSLAEETAVDEADRASVLALLRDLGLLGEQSSERERVEALHRFLTWTPAKLIGVALPDAVGDRRAMNQPGTHLEYPNWRLPLADGVGRPVLLEDVMASVRAASLARTVNGR
jgi:4-alpha-glucanotransferase